MATEQTATREETRGSHEPCNYLPWNVVQCAYCKPAAPTYLVRRHGKPVAGAVATDEVFGSLTAGQAAYYFSRPLQEHEASVEMYRDNGVIRYGEHELTFIARRVA
jgi:hypothetical protein